MAPIIGVTIFSTREVTIAPNAAPMTTATARSKTFPLRMNALNSPTRPLFMPNPPQSSLAGCPVSLPEPLHPAMRTRAGEPPIRRVLGCWGDRVLGEGTWRTARFARFNQRGVGYKEQIPYHPMTPSPSVPVDDALRKGEETT